MEDDLQQLRSQRNRAAIFAVAVILLGLLISLPRAIDRRHHLKQARGELTRLQKEIVETQQRTSATQKAILQVQQEILSLQK